MSRLYDRKTTTFSPDGRLLQIEYAITAINHAGACVGILGKDGVVMCCEKKVRSKMLEYEKEAEKMFRIDHHVSCAVAGISSDANILIEYARLIAQRFNFTYNDPIPVENLVRSLCDLKQSYTQFGGKRPFGVSFIFAGWDEQFGFQLYHSDPSGNFGGWKAIAIGSNNVASQSILKTEWKKDMSMKECLELAVKVMIKTMDSSSLTFDNLEFASLTRDKDGVRYCVFDEKDVNKLIKKVETRLEKEAEKK